MDHAHQVIVAARATNQSSDKQQAVVMIEETISNTGAVPKEVSADAGYYSAKAVDDLQALGVDAFVAPEQTRHGRVVPPAPRGRIPKHLSPRCPASTIFAGWRQSVLPVHLLGLDALLGSVGPVAGDVKLQDDGVVHDPVNRRGGGHGIGKDALPLGEDQV